MSFVNTADCSYKALPIRYVTPIEYVAMAMKAGDKRWTKARDAGKARQDYHVLAVWTGCEIRTCLPSDLGHVQDHRGDEGWQLEVGIHPSRPKWLHKAMLACGKDPESDALVTHEPELAAVH